MAALQVPAQAVREQLFDVISTYEKQITTHLFLVEHLF